MVGTSFPSPFGVLRVSLRFRLGTQPRSSLSRPNTNTRTFQPGVLKQSSSHSQTFFSTFPHPPPPSSNIHYYNELRDALSPTAKLTTNPYELAAHGKDESYHPPAPPDLVVYPATIPDIQAVLAIARRDRIPVIPYGAGTSVEGHIQALHGGISLDMSLWDHIQTLPSLYPEEDATNATPLATVGAGVRRLTLASALRNTGYWFPVDPGADASLGGMLATAASGTTAVRYGTMRRAVAACTAVLADGTVVHTGRTSPKNAAGYDVTNLLVGSEGTLGIVTELTLRLQPVLEYRTNVVVVFSEGGVGDAAQLAADLQMVEVSGVLRCELLDGASVAAFNQYAASEEQRPEQPTVFLELQSFSDVALEEQVKMTRELCAETAVSFETGPDPKLWEARHKLYYAAIAARPKASGAIVTDACVPLSQFAAVLEATVADVKESQVVGPCFGHAGDGNLHCILPVCDDDEETGYAERLRGVQDRLMERTLAAGGSVSGEHGVGSGKRKYMEKQYGPGALHMMRLVKQAMDPYNILNPGKVIP